PRGLDHGHRRAGRRIRGQARRADLRGPRIRRRRRRPEAHVRLRPRGQPGRRGDRRAGVAHRAGRSRSSVTRAVGELALGLAPARQWRQGIADAAVGRHLVAVAGPHGKSTTAAWLAWVLAEGGADPGAFVGALLPAALSGGVPATARLGRGVPFVVEADEYAGN